MFKLIVSTISRRFLSLRSPGGAHFTSDDSLFKYKSFISYSSIDGKFSSWLHRKLEGYQIPSDVHNHLGLRSLHPICLDQEDLPSSSNLGGKLEDELRRSYSLIVICSSASAESKWVNAEVKFFKESLGRQDRIFCVLLNGELPSCCPAVLQDGKGSIEPLAADFRGLEFRGFKKIRDLARTRQQSLKLIAGLIGVGYDDLRKRDKLRRRKRGALLSTLLVIAASVFATSIYWQKVRYQSQLKSARVLEYIERGREELLQREPLKALPYLSAAYEEGESSVSLRFLIARAMAPVDALKLSIAPSPKKIVYGGFSPDGKKIITINEDKTGEIRDALSGRALVSIGEPTTEISTFSFSPDSAQIAIANGEIGYLLDIRSGRQLAKLQGHSLDIKSMNFNLGGDLLITSSVDDTAIIWDVESGKIRRRLIGHEATVNYGEFSSDGRRVLTVSNDKTARVWNVQTGRIVQVIQAGDLLLKGEFNKLGDRILLRGAARFIGLYRITGEMIGAISKGGAVSAAFFAPDDKSLIIISTQSDGHTLRLSRLPSAQPEATHVLAGHTELVGVVEPDSSAYRIATAGFDQTIRIWNSTTGELEEVFSVGPKGGSLLGVVSSAAFNSSADRLMVTTGDGELIIWDSSATSKKISSPGSIIKNIAYTSDGLYVVTVDHSSAKIWRVEDGQLSAVIRPTEGILWAKLSDSGRYLFMASPEGKAYLWSVPGGKLRYSLQGHSQEIRSADFGHKDEKLITAGADGSVIVWDLGEKEKIASVVRIAASKIVSAQFSPTGENFLVSGQGVGVSVWRAGDGRNVRTLVSSASDDSVLNSAIVSAYYCADGSIIVTGGERPGIWGPGGALISELPRAMKGWVSDLSPDGERFITSGFDEPVRIWSCSTGKLLGTLRSSRILSGSAIFSPDGFLIMTSGIEGAQIWDASNGSILLELGRDRVSLAAFSPRGDQIATVTSDGVVEVWGAHLEARSPADISRIIRRLVPWHLVDGSLSQARRQLLPD